MCTFVTLPPKNSKSDPNHPFSPLPRHFRPFLVVFDSFQPAFRPFSAISDPFQPGFHHILAVFLPFLSISRRFWVLFPIFPVSRLILSVLSVCRQFPLAPPHQGHGASAPLGAPSPSSAKTRHPTLDTQNTPITTPFRHFWPIFRHFRVFLTLLSHFPPHFRSFCPFSAHSRHFSAFLSTFPPIPAIFARFWALFRQFPPISCLFRQFPVAPPANAMARQRPWARRAPARQKPDTRHSTLDTQNTPITPLFASFPPFSARF